jgi:hypothetical protein
MNQRNPIVMIVLAGLLTGLFVMISILMSEGNEIASFYQYLLIVFFLLGFLMPKGTFIFWLGLCGYTDLLKRFMVVMGRVSFTDLYYVLGIPPVMLVAITLSVLVGALKGSFQLKKAHWFMLAIACSIMLMVTAFAAKSGAGSLQAILPLVANDGLYALLIFVVPVLFPTSDDALKLLRLVLWFYLPVAIYGIIQQVCGFQDFEIEYLKSGLTIEVKQLITDEIRAFSTLNSPTALAAICASLAAVTIMLSCFKRQSTGSRALGWIPATLVTLVFLGGLVASTGRAAVTVTAFTLGGWMCFRFRRLLVVGYVLGIGSFIWLIFSADQLLADLNVYQDRVSTSIGNAGQFATQMSRLNTYSDRLQGFSHLVKNPDAWTLFGHGAEADDDNALYSHDLLTNILTHYGVIALALLLVTMAIGVTYAHRRVLRLEDPDQRSLAAAMMAEALSFIILSMLAGNVLVVFPINVFTYFFLALLVVVVVHNQTLQEAPEAASEEIAPEPLPTAPRMVHRFTRSGQLPYNLNPPAL